MPRVDVEELIEAAQRHGERGEPGHEVGDLQDLLRAAWRLLNAEQVLSFLATDEVESVWNSAYGE